MRIDTRVLASIAFGLAAVLSIAVASAQSDIGECSAGPSADLTATPDALYRLDGEVRTEDELSAALQQALFDIRLEHYERQLEIIDAAVLEDELARRAEHEGSTTDAVANELFAVAPPDDTAIEAFYRENRERIPYPIDAVRDQIRQMLVQRQVQIQQAEIVAQVKQERSFEPALVRPVAPYADIAIEGFPSKGAAHAKVTVVEFADYQCPHCKRAGEALKRIEERYRGQVRVVFLDFPVNPSGVSRVVAEGAACADQQGRFWDYHDSAFDRQAELGPQSASRLAAELELDETAFQSCMGSGFARERVASSEAEARRLGLSSTPTLFLNGRRLHVRDFETEIVAEIDDLLAEQTD